MMRLPTKIMALAAVSLSSMASAATVDLSFSGTTPTFMLGVYTVARSFVLPAGFTNATLTITDLTVDDRGVLFLNGAEIDSAGIYAGPGKTTGSFSYTFGGANNPYDFNSQGSRNNVYTTGFLTGANSISLIVNDTNNGIYGTPLANVALSSYNLTAVLTYDVAAAVPEPAAWAMMLTGFGLVGAAARRRRTATQFA